MAKSKHQKLADLLRGMLRNINERKDKVAESLNFIQIDQDKFEQSKLKALLYCPSKNEISNEIDWFEKENFKNSFTHIFFSICEYQRENAIIRDNLAEDAFQAWTEAKLDWQSNPSEASDPSIVHEVPYIPQRLEDLDFAPQQGLSIELAYEKVLQSINKRQSKHRHSLRQIYKKKLEDIIFKGVNWSILQKKAFLSHWKDRFFKRNIKPHQPKYGRWEQCESIDRYTASRIIKYFVDGFIITPSNKKDGEIACILWILIWIAQQDMSDRVTLQEVLNIRSTDIDLEDAIIHINGLEIDISWGLHELLKCLVGKGKAIRSRRLFHNLDLDGKTIERALIKASSEMLGSEATPILPAAFFAFPHPYPDQRIPAAELKAMRNVPSIISIQSPRRKIYTAIREAKARKNRM